jgi:uncharacterized repeat protein (TIGR01451 family)
VPCAQPCATPQALPYSVEIDERISPIVDCNPVKTQHTLVVTVRDQCGNPMPGQRVEWILTRYSEAVGDIVAVDDQYGCGVIAPMTNAYPGNNGNKIDNHYAASVTNYGAEMIDAGNNHPYIGSNGARLPDITVGQGQSWLTITSSREGVTDICVFVSAIRDGTTHKIWAKKVWADFDVEFPQSAVNVLPNDSHSFPVTVFRSDGSGIPGQEVEAEILDGPGAVFARSNAPTATLLTNANGVADFALRNVSGQSGVNRVRFTVNGTFYGEVCPRSAIVTKTWQQVNLEVACTFPCGAEAVVGKPFEKVLGVRNLGDATADSVMLDDQPEGLTILDGTTFPMEVGPLAPGQTITRTIRVMAQVGGTVTNRVIATSATSNSRAESTCSLEIVQGNLEITKVCEPTVITAGEEVTFVVTVSNTGRGPLENVVVRDTYPQGIEPTSQDVASVGTLMPGESRQVLFTGIGDAPGTYTNTATATADGVDEKSAQCTVQVVICRLEMELVGPDQIYYGEQANFTVVVRNVGDGPADSCIVRVTTGNCLGNLVQDFNVGPLGPGQTWTQDFGSVATSTGSCTVTADSDCMAKCQIRKDIQLLVTGLPALQVEMIDLNLDGSPAGIFRIGETFIYRLMVENDVGTEAIPPMTVDLRLPPELEFVSGRSDRQAGVNGSGQQASTDPFPLAINEVITFDLQVRVRSAPASGLVKAEVFVKRGSDGAVLAGESESTTVRR